jgi:hypothetical protein
LNEPERTIAQLRSFLDAEDEASASTDDKAGFIAKARVWQVRRFMESPSAAGSNAVNGFPSSR